MSRRRWLWLAGAGAALIAAGVLWAGLREPLALRLMERGLRANMQANLLDELPDGLHLVLCGAGSPLPDVERGGPCAAVIAGRRLFVVDAGAGAARTMARLRLPPGEIEAILLTHFHSDHLDGLGELLLQRWIGSASQTPTPVHGPEGVEQVVAGFALAYAQDSTYRTAHHGPGIAPPSGAGATAQPFATPPPGQGHVVIGAADGPGALRVTAFRVDHAPVAPAVGYRFDYAGRSLLLSGDTARSANLLRFAKGVDLLVHDALSPWLVDRMTEAAEAAQRPRLAKITRDIRDYHASPVQVAELAREAGAKRLLFHHIVPPLPLAPLQGLFLRGVRQRYPGPVSIGRDGSAVSLPARGKENELRQLF